MWGCGQEGKGCNQEGKGCGQEEEGFVQEGHVGVWPGGRALSLVMSPGNGRDL